MLRPYEQHTTDRRVFAIASQRDLIDSGPWPSIGFLIDQLLLLRPRAEQSWLWRASRGIVRSSVLDAADMSADAQGDKPRPGLAAGEVDAESVVRQLGQAGRFHLRVYVLVALAAVQVGLLHTTYIFLAASVPYRYVLK